MVMDSQLMLYNNRQNKLSGLLYSVCSRYKTHKKKCVLVRGLVQTVEILASL